MRTGVFAALMGVVLVASACTADTSETTVPTASTTTAPAVTTTTLLDIGALASRHLVEIRSEGAFLEGTGSDAPGQGTGLIVSADGLILTTATAVVGATRINVYETGAEFPLEARIEAVAECLNLALVKVDGAFSAASIDSATEPVGLLSMVDRTPALESANNAVDVTNVSVGSWTVGGVAIDASGAIAGMAVRAGDDGGPVILPLDALDRWLSALRARDTIEQLGFAGVSVDGGVAVTGVTAQSDAARAGLAAGDVITAVADDPLDGGFDELCARILSGERSVELFRDGRRYVGDLGGSQIALASARTLDQLREAVVRVDAFISGFDEPASGSGFFVDETGTAVTNYHVVAGADRVELVFDGGERRVAATVLGRSMCHDLAVVQADGDGYEYLEWSPDAVELEQPVRSLGFPLGTDTFTVQPGAVAKERADDVSFAPLLTLFEHSAEVNPGNSGGPVVNSIGEIVGVTNAVSTQGFSAQELAISGVEAVVVADALMKGDVFHPGFWAVEDRNISERYAGFLNLTVASIDPGGVADRSGIRPGDDIVEFGGVRDVDDGLDFGSLCTRLANGGMSQDVVVHRWQEELHLAGVFGQPLQDISGFGFGEDPTGVLGAQLPANWSDVRQISPADGNDWNGFRAGPNVDAFLDEFGRRPGARFLFSTQLAEAATTREYLDAVAYPQCDVDPTFEVFEPELAGHGRQWTNCFGEAFSIRSYALDDSNGDRVLVLIAAADIEIGWIESLVLDTLVFEPPIGEGDDG